MDRKFTSAFTVDVEDGISIAMRDAFSIEMEQTKRVVYLTSTILDLLAQKDVKGTFFVLGQVAEKFPDLVKKIADEGHELGVHGYNHLQFFKMTKEKAFEELSSAKKLIEDISGVKVFGHRAPAFSITPETEWGLDVIAEAGFIYDSSIMPINGRRYGWPDFSPGITEIITHNGHRLIEVPMSTLKIIHKRIPVCGGGYLRLFPEGLTKRAFEKIIKNQPAIVYIHPYELDTERYPDYYFTELGKASFLKRVKMKSMWWNRKTMYSKLEMLFQQFEFEPLKDVVANDQNLKSSYYAS